MRVVPIGNEVTWKHQAANAQPANMQTQPQVSSECAQGQNAGLDQSSWFSFVLVNHHSKYKSLLWASLWDLALLVRQSVKASQHRHSALHQPRKPQNEIEEKRNLAIPCVPAVLAHRFWISLGRTCHIAYRS